LGWGVWGVFGGFGGPFQKSRLLVGFSLSNLGFITVFFQCFFQAAEFSFCGPFFLFAPRSVVPSRLGTTPGSPCLFLSQSPHLLGTFFFCILARNILRAHGFLFGSSFPPNPFPDLMFLVCFGGTLLPHYGPRQNLSSPYSSRFDLSLDSVLIVPPIICPPPPSFMMTGPLPNFLLL